MKSPRKKTAAAKLRNWRVSIMRARGQALGTVAAPDQESAEAEAVRAFGLSEDQRKRLLILEHRPKSARGPVTTPTVEQPAT
jgi:hypothetical protein